MLASGITRVTIQTQLDRFIASFTNEAELRTAIIGLLERMPNASNVRLTHGGSAEKGKDIVFHSLGPFGQRQLVACVVKNDRITGSADSNHGARNVLFQAEQALDTPIPSVANGSDEHVSQVFVISPHECSPTTVDSIKSKLQNRTGQVTFICGRELLEKFEIYYQEYMLFQSGLYGAYIGNVVKGLDSDPAVINILFQRGFTSGPKKLTELYVRPKFLREFRIHTLITPRPEVTRLMWDLTRDNASELQKAFLALGRLVAAITLPDEDGAELDRQFEKLADVIGERWENAFERYRKRQDLTKEERYRPKNEIALQLSTPDEVESHARDLLSRTEKILQEFAAEVDRANICAQARTSNPLECLHSPLLLDYSEVEGVSRQAPSLVQAEAFPLQTIELDEALMDSVQRDLLIVAPAGFGKTSFCKWQTLDEIKKFQQSTAATIPVYVPLHQYAVGELGTFEDTFLRTSDLISLWQQRKGKNYRFRLYLDGIDEIPSLQRQKEIVELAFNGKNQEPTLSIVATGREHVVGRHLRQFARVRVRDFDENQIIALAQNWFEKDEFAIQQFFDQLEKVPTLRPLMTTPLLATLIFGVYKNTKGLPESRVQLYDMFVNLLAGGWDVAKNIQRQAEFGPAAKLTILTRLAATLHLNERRDSTQMDFRNAVVRTLPGLLNKWQKILEETIRDGLLVAAGLNYVFAHHSFQEYLTARDLFEPAGRKPAAAFRNFLRGEEWWREVVAFYIGMSSDPVELGDFIQKTANSLLSKSADETIKDRARFLLDVLIMSFPGARPTLGV